MFGWLFGEDDEEVVVKKEEKVEQKVEPVVNEEEQKRKDKFSEPLIYNDEVPTVKVEEKPVVKTSKPASTTSQKKKTQSRRFDNTSDYKLVDIISPMSGLVDAASKGDDGKAPVTKKKRYRPKKEELVPVLSPFYGMGNVVEDEENDKNEDVVEETVETIENVETIEEVKEEKPKEKKKRAPRKKREKVVLEAPDDNDKPVDSAKVIGSVEDRLRNIATISEQTQDDLKIIEERTGKFRLIRKKDESLIDEIDDNMSLDELMTLYEKKFKD
ncbi:MAG: hypothetical protein J6P61_08405 [Erysipelotrichaceae bacterium]|nr:hypothetical protein [Erysipelotrichaceae bacterium]